MISIVPVLVPKRGNQYNIESITGSVLGCITYLHTDPGTYFVWTPMKAQINYQQLGIFKDLELAKQHLIYYLVQQGCCVAQDRHLNLL